MSSNHLCEKTNKQKNKKQKKQTNKKQKQVKKRNRRCRKSSCSSFSLFPGLGRVRHMAMFLCSLFFLASEECAISCMTDNVTRSWYRGQQSLEIGNWVARYSCHSGNNVLFNFLFHHACLLEFLWLSQKRRKTHKQRNHKKNICICYLPAGRSVLGKTMPEVLITARARRPRAVLKTEGTIFPITDRSRPGNNVFIFFVP